MATEFNGVENESENREARHYVWHASLSCGNDSIDADHRHLFDITERLRTAGMRDHEQVELGRTIPELMDYVGQHFAREEVLMQTVDYPGFTDHRLEHSLLVRRVKSLYKLVVEGEPLPTKETTKFLDRWLRYHIMHSDLDMARYAARWTSRHSAKDE